MLRISRVYLCIGTRIMPSKAYGNYVKMGIIEPNDLQREAMVHADRLYADLSRVLAGMDITEEAEQAIQPSIARLVAASPDVIKSLDAVPEEEDEVVPTDEEQFAEADRMPGSLAEFVPEIFVGTKRQMPKRDLLPPPKRHMGLIPVQYLEIEAMRQEELELGLRKACHPLSDVRGLYVHGGVGCGKSAVMNILFNELPTMHKKRTNFRQFVEEATAIYDHVHTTHGYESRDADHVMNEVGVRLCSTAEVLMLDDVRVQSDEEGVLLRRIFSAMYKIGICTVFTSQMRPEDLHSQTYQSRLAMESFVSMLYDRCELINLGDSVDYRVQSAFKDSGVFLSSDKHGSDAKRIFHNGFLQITDGRRPESRMIRAYGRDIEVERAVGGVCMVTYEELVGDICCDDEDMPLFARSFHTVFIEGLPRFSAAADGRAAASRFFSLVAALHRFGCKCVFESRSDAEHLIAPSDVPAIEGKAASPLLEQTSESLNSLQELEQSALMERAEEEFALATQTCEAQLAEMQTFDYLRTPHSGKPVSLVDGAPNADEVMARFDALKEADRQAGRDPDAEFEGSILTRNFAKRPTRMQ
jgi:predicted ATPase